MKQAGFSLVELISVMVIIGILATVALPRLLDTTTFDSLAFHDETLAALRYAQKSAISQRRNVCVVFTTNTVALQIASNAGPTEACGPNLAAPDGSPSFQIPRRTPARAAFSQSPPPADFQFNALGRPSVGQTIQVIGSQRTITIEAETGYVHS
jgi:MSHA pilin protein MshC